MSAKADLVIGIHQGEFSTLQLHGDLDLSNTKELRAALDDAMSGSKGIIVDLRQVDFIDSTALGALVAGMRRALKNQLGFVVVAPQLSLRHVFRITGIEKIIVNFDSVEEAISFLQNSSE